MTLTSGPLWHNTNVSGPWPTPIIPVSWGGPITTLLTTLVFVICAAAVSVHTKPQRARRKPIPLLNPRRWYELSTTRARLQYATDSWNMTLEGMDKYHGEPFRILMGEHPNRDAVVLPPRYAEELKNDRRLSFTTLKAKSLSSNIRGFQVFATLNQSNRLLQIVTQQDLTRALPRLTPALSAECAAVLKETIGDGEEWKEVVVQAGVSLPLVARLSTLAFMGPESCYDAEWIDIVTSFTENLFLASNALQTYPNWLRPLAHRFLGICRKLKAQERQARDIIDEKLRERRDSGQEEPGLGQGGDVRPNEALDWFQSQHARLGGEYYPALTQLMLSVAAIHTTSDLLTQVILNLAVHPELIVPLRKEVTEALDGGPINKTAMHKMKLLDSVMKESQRMKPIQIKSMEREVLEDVTLSDNVHLRRGTAIMIMPRMRDPALYENPDEFDGYRFYRLRQQPGKEKAGQVVTTTAEFPAFGLGNHACPGRFFAVHEVKVALCHLLLRYEWKVADGAEEPRWRVSGNSLLADAEARIAVRRREAE